VFLRIKIVLETKITTLLAEFAAIDTRDLPSMVLRKLMTRPDGKKNPVAIKVPVRDAALLARARQELRERDQIEVEVETRWAEPGIPKSLLRFSRVAVSQDRTLAAVG